MRYINIATIKIGENRQRRTLNEEALAQLAESIERNGLLHPIVVRASDNGSLTLVAGERRLRAAQILECQGKTFTYGGDEVPLGMIPANDVGELSEAEAWEAELEENVQRVDLSWQERTEAIANLHRLMEARAGHSLQPSDTGQAILGEDSNATAAAQKVRRALVLQQQIATDPVIAKAKSEHDAWKLVKRKEEAKLRESLAAAVGKEATSDLLTAINADCREWLKTASPGQFDAIVIDPPFGINAHKFGDSGGMLTGVVHGYDDSPETAFQLMQEIAPELWRVAKEQAHLYVWCDIDHFCNLRDLFTQVGWWVHRTPLVSVRKVSGRVPWPEHGPRRCYELILYANKGKRPVTAIYRDVLESKLERPSEGHGAAKPVEAYIDLLRRSCYPGNAVLDCFAGTGTILLAAHALQLRAVAVEVNPSYYGICLKQLEELK